MIFQRDVDMAPRSIDVMSRAMLGLALTAVVSTFSVAHAAQSGTAKAAKPAAKPVAKAASKTSKKPAAKPAAKPVAKPAVKPVVKPVVQPAPQPGSVGSAAPGAVAEEKVANTLVTFKMVKLPGGKIVMPNPKDPGAGQEVEVKPFWIGQKEVTWDEYDVFMFKLDLSEAEAAKADTKTRPSLPYGAPDRGYGHEGYAAISIHRTGAEQYCKWLSLKTGKKYRLATEAEWEYACRAGAASDSKMSADEVQKVAWVKENADDKTHGVGEKAPNAWGLHDMLGNAGEWVKGYDGDMVLKGGSFQEPAAKVNSTWRAKQTVAWHDPNKPKSVWWLADGAFAGFRIVRDE